MKRDIGKRNLGFTFMETLLGLSLLGISTLISIQMAKLYQSQKQKALGAKNLLAVPDVLLSNLFQKNVYLTCALGGLPLDNRPSIATTQIITQLNTKLKTYQAEVTSITVLPDTPTS